MAADNPYIEQSLIYQDLEKVRFSENLRKNASDYNQFVNDRVNEMTNEAFNRKRTAFQKAQIDLGRYMDMDHNANFYKSRNADIERVQAAIVANNNRIAQQVALDKDISKRQFEINEYYYYNKLETLFFLQLFFISALVMTMIIYLQKGNLITTTMAGLLTTILLAIVIITGVARYFYTSRTRDTRLWHKRRFPKEAPEKRPAFKCGNGGQVEFDLNSYIPGGVTECADEMAQNFNKWSDSLQREMAQYQETGMLATSNQGVGASICSGLAS